MTRVPVPTRDEFQDGRGRVANEDGPLWPCPCSSVTGIVITAPLPSDAIPARGVAIRGLLWQWKRGRRFSSEVRRSTHLTSDPRQEATISTCNPQALEVSFGYY